jgi:hypothetical protein
VDDAVPDRLGGDEVVNRLRAVAVDEVELQARRARVDGQNWFQRGASSTAQRLMLKPVLKTARSSR